MKKTLLTFFLLAATAFTFAQSVNFGLKAGLNFSELHRGELNSFFNDSFIQGFNAGGIADISFQNFSIQPGIFYSTKGEKIVANLVDAYQASAGTSTYNTKLNYIEVPVNFLYKINIVAPEINIHLGGGPYFGYGISKTISVKNNNSTSSYDNDHKFVNKNPDYGINFIVGTKINRIIVDASYGLGLANIGYNGYTLENRVISLSVGYLFK